MENEKLIEEVRNFSVLYDQRNEKYRNTEYKERVWKVISNTLKAPGGPDECKKRWTSIRDQFRRTLQKRKTKSGQAATKKQKYKYEENLEFLLPHIGERETLSNVTLMEFQAGDSTFDQIIDEPEKDPETERQSETEVWTQPGSSSQTSVQPTTLSPVAESSQANTGKNNNFSKPLNSKRRGYNQEKSFLESPSSQLMAYILSEKEAERKTQSATSLAQHPVEIFLAGLAPTLKSLDPVLLNQAKTAIFTIVQDFELKQLTKNEKNQQLTSPLSLDTDQTTFSFIMSGSKDSLLSSVTESPQYLPPNESHQQAVIDSMNQHTFLGL